MNTRKAELAGTFFTTGQLPADERPKVLFIGRSNVGKSSLINSLLECRLARTSSLPGKTLSVNYYAVGGTCVGLVFVDLPGYGFARVSKGETARVRALISGFLAQVRNVRLAMLLIDCRRGFLPPDLETLGHLVEKNVPILTILTKSDKLSLSEQKKLNEQLKNKFGLQAIFFSVKSPEAKNEIWRQIGEAMKE
ncbi:MAG: ribosome biogenesis GTP-binding protein YsxC [Candidatus Aminicenantes bacterium]|nr:ribosome biogenesis GTP-binding protein YsxC [Candidatus Aminicenantes bacterium]